MTRRSDTDPLLPRVSARLARLLAETAPPDPSPPDPALHDPAPHDPAPQLTGQGAAPAAAETARVTGPSTAARLLDVDEVPVRRRFGRAHLGVVCALLLVGLLWAGWSLLRARPVALATPVTVSAPATLAASPRTPAGGPTDARGPQAGSVVVHVLGAVRRPGLVTLPGHARVEDAVQAAGGFTRRADPGTLNLAQVLTDGQQVVIGTVDDPAGEVRNGPGSPGGGPDPAGSAVAVSLNDATPAQLEELPGVGPVTAAKILAWREAHGRFNRVEELQEVDGIGPKTYAEIAPHVRV